MVTFGRMGKSKLDLTVAEAMGMDIIKEFRNDYGSIPGFEEKNGLKLPEDIAAILTPPGA